MYWRFVMRMNGQLPTSTSTSINALMRMIIVVTCGLGSLTTYARTAVMPSRGKVLPIRRPM